jgi:hypothetical protein
MVANLVLMGFVAALVPYSIPVFVVLHHLGIGLFVWDVIRNPKVATGPTIGWIAGFYFLWFFVMPAYIYVCGREDEG